MFVICSFCAGYPHRYRHSGRRGAQRLGDPEPSGARQRDPVGSADVSSISPSAPLGSGSPQAFAGVARNDESGWGVGNRVISPPINTPLPTPKGALPPPNPPPHTPANPPFPHTGV